MSAHSIQELLCCPVALLAFSSLSWAVLNTLLGHIIKVSNMSSALHTRTPLKQVEVEYEVTAEKHISRELADVLVAADGSMSETRAKFLPGEPRR